MCLILFSLQQHPVYKLIIAANRDEFYDRKTAPADYWADYPEILAGRDLQAGGTWMGISTRGQISMLTNYRDPKRIDPTAPSRGDLVSDFLKKENDPEDYLRQIAGNGKIYNGFNLIVGNAEELWYYSNYGGDARKLSKGVYGISNHLLETPWPKVVSGKKKLEDILKNPQIEPGQLFEILYDDARASEEQLPDTGLSREREHALSSMFIKTENYGSRCSTVILIDNENKVLFSERVFNTKSFEYSTKTFQFPFKDA